MMKKSYDFNKSSYLHHRPPDLEPKASILKPSKLKVTNETAEDNQKPTRSTKKTPDSKVQRPRRPTASEIPQKISKERLNKFNAFKYEEVPPKNKRKADQSTKVSPPHKTTKSMSKGKMNLSGVISEGELDPLEELITK